MASHAAADQQTGAFKNVQESDGSPSCFGWQLLVSNGTLTDNADGTCTVTTGGGGANHNLLSATHPDTVAAAVVRGDLIVGNSTPAWARFAIGGSNTVLASNGTDPSWTGSPTISTLTLSVATTQINFNNTSGDQFEISTNSGTYLLSDSTAGRHLQVYDSTGKLYLPQITEGVLQVVGNKGNVISTPALPVSVGGTGAAPTSDDQVIVSDTISTATWRTVPNCTDAGGNHLNYTASSNSFSCGTTSSGGAGHNILSATHSDSVAASATRGDLIVANSTPSWARFAVGGSNTVLTANGTDPAWSGSPTLSRLTLSATTTELDFNNASGDQFEISSNAGALLISDVTASKHLLVFDGAGQVYAPQISAGALKVIGNKGHVVSIPSLDVPVGGTGTTTFTLNGVLYGNGSGSIQSTAQGSANTVLTANAGVPAFSGSPTVSSLTLSDATTQLNFNNTSGDQFEISSNAGTWLFADSTSGQHLLIFNSAAPYLPQLSAGLVQVTGNKGLVSTTTTPNIAALTLQSATPVLNLNPTSGNKYEWNANGSVLTLAQTTTPKFLIQFDANDNFYLRQMNCSASASGGKLTVNAIGLVSCDNDNGGDKEFYWPAAALLAMEPASDNIPPVAKVTGTNVDLFTVDFDDTTKECRGGTFLVPSTIITGLVTFRARWFPATAATTSVVWSFSHLNRSSGVTYDAAFTTIRSQAVAGSNTSNVTSETVWSTPVSTLGWTASQTVHFELCREPTDSRDNLVGDARLIGFSVEIPR